MYNENFDLFLSYSRNSLEMAEKIANELEKNGLFVWIDRTDVILGSDIESSLLGIFDSAKNWLGIIMLFDKTYFSKKWCVHELELALSNKMTLFPILYGIEKSSIPLEYAFLRKINMVTIREPSDFDYAINKILSALISTIPLTEIIAPQSEIYKVLLLSYKRSTKAENEKVICADNVAHFVECSRKKELTHFDLLLTKIIHNKCSKLYKLGSLDVYDVKVACNAADVLIKRIKQI